MTSGSMYAISFFSGGGGHSKAVDQLADSFEKFVQDLLGHVAFAIPLWDE